LVRYISKVVPNPQVFNQTPRPNGIPLTQSCLEILPVIMESYNAVKRAQCCLWFHHSQLPTSVHRKFRTKYHKKSPQRMSTVVCMDNRSGCNHRCRHDSWDLGQNCLQMGQLQSDTRKPHWTPV